MIILQLVAALMLGVVVWRLADHMTRPSMIEARPFECRCGRAYRNDHALAQHVGCMHPSDYDGCEVGEVRAMTKGDS